VNAIRRTLRPSGFVSFRRLTLLMAVLLGLGAC